MLQGFKNLTSLLQGGFRTPRKGNHNDEAHPPIHPVRSAINLTGDDRKVYDFITRRFLACCSDAARGQETVVYLSIQEEQFTAKGLMILERNYLQVYPFDKWSNSQVGTFQETQEFIPTEIKITPGSTTKPKMLTEADLITLMDNAGIGTDATIHEHIKTILTREYVTKDQGFFYPTTLGMALVMGYERLDFEIKLSKPELRAMMESNMKLICDGQKTKDEVIKDVLEIYRTVFDDAVGQVDLIVDCFADYMVIMILIIG
jgi:DNA topoisomerase-3